MPTAIEDRKRPLKFTTSATIKYRGKRRRIIFEVHPNGMLTDVRLERSKTRFPISFEGIYHKAAANAAARVLAEKKAAKKKK